MLPGERVRRFEITGEGARGGTAAVFRAGAPRDVALKVLRPGDRPAGAAEVKRALVRIGLLPDAAARAAPRDMRPTISGNDAYLCGILIGRAGDDVPMLPALDAAIAVEAFDCGVAAVVAGDAAVAIRHALAMSRAMPDAAVVVAPGASTDDCIDRGARLRSEIELASQLSDPPGGPGAWSEPPPAAWPGVWIDPGAGERLVASFHIERAGRHLQVLGELT